MSASYVQGMGKWVDMALPMYLFFNNQSHLTIEFMTSTLYVLQSETKLGYLTYLKDHAQEHFDIIFVARGNFYFQKIILKKGALNFPHVPPPPFPQCTMLISSSLPLSAHHGLSFLLYFVSAW